MTCLCLGNIRTLIAVVEIFQTEIKFAYFFSTVSSILKKVNILYVPIHNLDGNMIVWIYFKIINYYVCNSPNLTCFCVLLILSVGYPKQSYKLFKCLVKKKIFEYKYKYFKTVFIDILKYFRFFLHTIFFTF